MYSTHCSYCGLCGERSSCGMKVDPSAPCYKYYYIEQRRSVEKHRTVVPVVALLYSRLREDAFTLCLRYGKRTTCAALNVSNPHACQAVFTHNNDAWSPQMPPNSRRAIIGGGCPLTCPTVDAKLRVSRAAFTNRGMQ